MGKGIQLVFMGVCGSGKTTLAEEIARYLGCEPVLEADDFHTPANREKMRVGIPLSDTDRWPWLDSMRAAMVAARGRDMVITCSALKRLYRDRLCSGELAGLVHFIFLDAPYDIIAERLASRKHAYMNSTLLRSQFEALERPGSDEPATTISVEGAFDQTVATVVDCIKRLM